MTRSAYRKRRVGRVRRRRRTVIVLIFALLFLLVAFVVLHATVSLPYESVNMAEFAKLTFDGFNNDGTATIAPDDAAIDALLSRVKEEYDGAWFHTSEVEDADYAKFRQSLSFSTPNTSSLSNGDIITVTASYDEALAEKLKIKIKSNSGTVTVEGLQNVTRIPVETVFSDLAVSFTGISPQLIVSIQNNSTHPLVKNMIFEIVNPKEYYAEGDLVKIQGVYTEEMCRETGYIVEETEGGCVHDYVASCDSAYVSSAAELPSEIVRKAVDAGRAAFSDANEYGVRIFCEANLVPVYINKKATFTYGTPNFVSAYFKTVFPEKAGQLGMSYNDLDIIYDVVISQADGKACTAYGAVRFSDIIRNSDGTYSYDFSSPQLLSVSYMSARVKSNVVDSYKKSYEIERVYP